MSMRQNCSAMSACVEMLVVLRRFSRFNNHNVVFSSLFDHIECRPILHEPLYHCCASLDLNYYTDVRYVYICFILKSSTFLSK